MGSLGSEHLAGWSNETSKSKCPIEGRLNIDVSLFNPPHSPIHGDSLENIWVKLNSSGIELTDNSATAYAGFNCYKIRYSGEKL